MYAQLCKRLSDEAPNFDGPEKPCTFLNLLLNVCRDRFLSRASVVNTNNSNSNSTSSGQSDLSAAEEEEKRHVAKQRMLGNVKFICELSKLDMLSYNTLHKCIQQLLDKNRSGTIKDRCNDMECLSQLIQTCGKNLDTEVGKSLMDQYFDKMETNSQSTKYPPRIRFMLRDLIELRRNGWVPRKMSTIEGPVPIQSLRPDDDLICSPYINRNRNQQNNEHDSDRWMNKMPLNLTPSSNHDWPGGLSKLIVSPPYKPTGNYNKIGGGFNNQRNNQNHSHNSYNNHNRYNKHNQHNSHNNYNNSNMLNNKDLAPRFKRNLITPPQDSVENLTFRPAANSLLFKANVNIKTSQLPLTQPRPSSASSADATIISSVQNTLKMPPTPVNNLLNKDQILIKQASLEKPKQTKKDKGPNKEEVMKRVLTFLSDYFFNNTTENERNIDDIVSAFHDLKVPDKFMRDAMTTTLNEIIDKNEAIHERVFEFLVCLRKEGKLNTNAILEGFKAVINSMNDSTIPRIATLVSSLLCRAVIAKLCKIADISTYTENGQHYPLFLLVLQQLNKTLGKQALIELFNESKVNLLSTLPEADRNKNRMAEILEDRNLSFLYPLLKLQGELQKQVQADANPQQLYKWIKDNIESTCYSDPGFITALMNVLLKYITQESTLSEGIDATKNPDKSLQEKERSLLEKYAPVLNQFLSGNLDLQMVALYALQVYCHSVEFPKGMLLRWFTALYDLNVIEEEAFMRWKEDLSDAYPGKGNALFQVHTYLQWLETAESEEEDERDD